MTLPNRRLGVIHRLRALAAAVGLTFAASCAHGGNAMARKIFGRDVKGSSIPDGQASPGALPAELGIGEPHIKVERREIILEVPVTNSSDKPVTLDVFPAGGTFPYGGDSPVVLAIASAEVRYTGPTYPPEPPLPMRITFPARTELVFPAALDLRNFSWVGAPEVSLQWSFRGMQAALREGTVKTRLPKP